MIATLIGNCQATALGVVMRRSSLLDLRGVIDVNTKGQDTFSYCLSSLYSDDENYVLSQMLSDDFAELSWARLSEHFRNRLIGYTNIYFSGLHPDLTYFGGRGLRVVGPLTDYHSRIVLAAFLQRRSTAECRAAFNGSTFERLGYFSHFSASLAELERRDGTNTVKFASTFAQLTQSTLTMLSVNHPTLVTIVELARMIEAVFSDRRSDLSADVCSSFMAAGPVWPLYPEVREHNRLPYETPFLFYPPEGAGPAMTLDEFILASYASYEQQGREVLAAVDADGAYAALSLR